MSDRVIFYGMLAVFLVASIALFLGASAQAPIATLFGLVGWIVSLGILVYWLIRKRNAALQ